MKKFLAFATLASVALVGCVNDEKMEMTSGAQKISFDTPVMSTQTRAVFGEINTTTYPDGEQFVVFAKQTSGNLKTWNDGTNFWSSTDESIVVKKEADNNWQHASKDYYWPKSTTDDEFKLSFNAYSPSELGGGAAFCNNGGLTIQNFSVNNTVNQQVDLMYSGPILNRTEKLDGVNGVQVQFKHALSSVVFAAVEYDDAASYEINSIKVNGNFTHTATFAENLTQTSGSEYAYTSTEAAKAAWTAVTTNDVTYEPVVVTAGVPSVVSTSDASTIAAAVEEVTNGTSAILPIPQVIPTDATVEINYTVTPTNGVPTTYTKTIRLLEFTKADGVHYINKWDMATRYTYVIKFGGTKPIFFVPKVTEWVNADAVYFEI